MKTRAGIGARLWSVLVLLGLAGQFAWTIENMYFNVFLYNTISGDPGYVAAMVAASAVVATLTTLLMGVVSDRTGKRKPFICGGYLLWGLSTMAFGLVTVENAAVLFPSANAIAVAAMMVIGLDCVMTFFGSTANDAAFNAYVTDVVPNNRRGKVESVLSILPLLSMLIIFGLFDGMTQAGQWREFFFIFGISVIATGIIALFVLEEAPIQPERKPFLSQLVYGFRPSVVREHKGLYLSLAAMCVFSVAVQVFFPYLIIYMQHYLKLDAYAIVLGVVLIVASLVSVIGGRFIDRVGKLRFALPAALIMLAGLVAMFFTRQMLPVILAGMVMMSGYMLLTSALMAQIRDLTPADKAGHFQGVRMVFSVMLPMLIGPAIGAWVIKGNAATYVDLGQTKTVPTPGIFLAAAAVLLLTAIPLWGLARCEKKTAETKEESAC
ncbi:MAG: MFS transporter [Clostridiales bacterium]|nr:MFS transporter [Clostridiales bacterium]